MRSAFIFSFLLALAGIAHAQEQEKKLLDRLLKPDMTLQNDVQNKQFTGAGGETITKKAPTKSFFVAPRKAEKGFWNTRQVSTKEFGTENSRDAHKMADLSTRSQIAKANTPYATAMYGDVRTARDTTKKVPVSGYADTRPFLEKGKSQKSLNAPQKPMSIDDVRELLNKNK